jgi:hypothetical protein
LPDKEVERKTFAYNIASLLSTNYVRSLEENDPVIETLTLAGELEVPNDNSQKKWQELCRLIDCV